MQGLLVMLGLSNIHPLVVHFPLALLILYSLLEFIFFKKAREKLFITKAILVILGTISIFVAREAGELAAKGFTNGSLQNVLTLHQTFSLISLYIFLILSASYILMIIRRTNSNLSQAKLVLSLHAFASNPFFLMLFALLGLFAITITGAMGGILVWGEANDPFAQIIYNFFVKQ